MSANTVVAIGAALCVPVIILLTLEVERRIDGWAQRLVGRKEKTSWF
jgi:hypothetical protein